MNSVIILTTTCAGGPISPSGSRGPRQGLGRNDEYLEAIKALAREFEDSSGENAEWVVNQYRANVAEILTDSWPRYELTWRQN